MKYRILKIEGTIDDPNIILFFNVLSNKKHNRIKHELFDRNIVLTVNARNITNFNLELYDYDFTLLYSSKTFDNNTMNNIFDIIDNSKERIYDKYIRNKN